MTAAPLALSVSDLAEVHIWIDTTQPPTGRVVTEEDETTQPFLGWLQLLTTLAHAVQPPAAAPLTPPSATPEA